MSVRRNWVASLSVGLAVLALLVLFSGLLMARSGSGLVPFRWVDVSGPFHRVSAEQIRAAVAPELARGFFFVDLPAVRERVLALPWVAEAEVRKHWPDSLEVRVSERSVLGRLGNTHLVDVDGAIFAARGAGETRGLPLFDAEPGQMADLVQHYRQGQRSLERLGRGIVAAELSPRGALSFRLDDGIRVQLGSRLQQERWQRLLRSLPKVVANDPRPIAQIDLRYTHGFAVRFQDPAAAAAREQQP